MARETLHVILLALVCKNLPRTNSIQYKPSDRVKKLSVRQPVRRDLWAGLVDTHSIFSVLQQARG